MSDTSLRTRAIYLFIGTALVVMMAFSVITWMVASRLISDAKSEAVSGQLQILKAMLTLQVESHKKQLEQFSTQNPELIRLLDKQTKEQYALRDADPDWQILLRQMKTLKAQSPEIVRVVYAGSEKHGQLYSNLNLSTTGYEYDARQRPWYLDARRRQQTVIATYPDFNREKPAVTLSVPIYHPEKKDFVGVSGMDLSVEKFLDPLRSVSRDTSLKIQVIDENGRILLSEDPFFQLADLHIADSIFHLSDSSFSLSNWIQAVGNDSVQTRQSGERILFATRSSSPSWVIVGSVFLSGMDWKLKNVAWMLLFFNISAFGGLLILIWIYSGRIIKPINQLTGFLNSAASGGGFKIEHSVFKDREIRELNNAIRNISTAQLGVIERIKDAGIQLSMVSDQINTMMVDFKENTVNVTSSVAETTSAMEEMAASGDQIFQSAEDVGRLASETSERSVTGRDSFATLAGQMNGIHQVNENRSHEIVSLGKKAGRITEIISIISGINEQTKIIAFNAALEASNAGESGKRFEVVAGEIRRLADTVQEATDEVKTMVREIQESVTLLIKGSEEMGKTVNTGVQMVRNLSESMNEFSDLAQTTTVSIKQIQNSTRQQKIAGEEIVATLHLLTNTMDSMTSMSEVLSGTAGKLNDLSVKLVEMAIVNA